MINGIKTKILFVYLYKAINATTINNLNKNLN